MFVKTMKESKQLAAELQPQSKMQIYSRSQECVLTKDEKTVSLQIN